MTTIPFATLTPADIIMLTHICSDAPGAAVDWLLERNTPIGDVLLAFAGNQEPEFALCNCGCKREPELDLSKWQRGLLGRCPRCRKIDTDKPIVEPFTTGLPHAVFLRWLKATEPDRNRWQWVECTRYRRHPNDHGLVWLTYGYGAKKSHATETAAIRDMKRRCLGLFPEVSWPCMRTYTDPVYDGVVTQSGTVTAPDLIPPSAIHTRIQRNFPDIPADDDYSPEWF